MFAWGWGKTLCVRVEGVNGRTVLGRRHALCTFHPPFDLIPAFTWSEKFWIWWKMFSKQFDWAMQYKRYIGQSSLNALGHVLFPLEKLRCTFSIPVADPGTSERGILFVLFIAAWAIFQLSGGCHHYRWQGCKFRPMLGTQGLWAGRAFYRATAAVIRDIGFSGLIWRTAPISRFLRHTWECGGSILTRILTGMVWTNYLPMS